jgi:type VI secretion system protein ImpC
MARESSVAPKERVNIVYRPATGDAKEEVELPLKLLIMGDYTLRHDDRLLEERQTISVDRDNFDEVMRANDIRLAISVPDRLSGKEGNQLAVSLRFTSMKDFSPERVASQIPIMNKLVELRMACTMIRDLLDRIPAFRERLELCLTDRDTRDRLKAELKGDTAQSPNADETKGSIIDRVMQETLINSSVPQYEIARRNVKAVCAELLGSTRSDESSILNLVDHKILKLDKKLSNQMDAVLHHPDFQWLESAWRGLKLVVDRTEFRENIKIELLNVSKEELLEDLDYAPDVTKSGLYRQVYTQEYGAFGGQPFSAMIGNYYFNPVPKEIKLLQHIASVSSTAHLPFIATADPSFFGIESFAQLPGLKDIKAILEKAEYTRWQSFREFSHSRYVGLTLPRFLLRHPYGPETQPVRTFNYLENISSNTEHYLWGNTAFAFATRLTESFAKYRWCVNIIGPQGGGSVEGLPPRHYEAMGAIQTKTPMEALISDRRGYELAEEGFIPLAMRKGSDNPAFFSANSVHKTKSFGLSKEGKQAELSYKLGAQLPYTFVISRLAHYIKVLQRENIGFWKERSNLELELNNWIRQYVADADNPAPGVRSRRPFRRAQVTVEDVEGELSWYRMTLRIKPHFKYMGMWFTLSLVGMLEKD